MCDDYLWDLGRFAYAAHRLPRKGFVGETVFYNNWLKLLKAADDSSEPMNQKFSDILGSYGHRLDERAATVASTFIAWLGTNMGYSFRHEAKELAKALGAKGSFLPDVYLMSWAKFNVRRTGCSANLRQLEALMTQDDKTVDYPSVQDYEVVDHLVQWLGSDEGQEFLDNCATETTCRQKNEDFRTYLEQTAGLPEHHVKQILRLAADYRPVDAK